MEKAREKRIENTSIQKRAPQKEGKWKLQSKQILRALMDPAESEPEIWSAADLQAILTHLLATPLNSELARFSEVARCPREEISTLIAELGYSTFGDVLWAHAPSEKVLGILKNYAKASLARGNDLPCDVARTLYVSTIVCGRKAGFREITTLDETRLKREIRRCLTHQWLPKEVCELLRSYLKNERMKG